MKTKTMKNDTGKFNEEMRTRTLRMSLQIHQILEKKVISALNKPLAIQLIRSASSVAANYRSATRGRSDAEFYSKICIVVEECDETEFWIEYLIKIGMISTDEMKDIMNELDHLIRIFSSTKRTMKKKLTSAPRSPHSAV